MRRGVIHGRAGGLQQAATALRKMGPPGYTLAHLTANEADLLTQVTGKQDVVPELNIRKFAGGGKVGGLTQLTQSVAGSGRGGDSTLAFITPDQMSLLKSRGGAGTINPQTGLPEYGWLGNLLKIVAPIALTFLAPGIGTALGVSAAMAASPVFAGLVTAVGSTLVNKATGASWGDALKGGAIAGVLSGVGKAVFAGAQGLSSSGGAGASAAGGVGATATGEAAAGAGASAVPAGIEGITVTGAQSPLASIAAASTAAAGNAIGPHLERAANTPTETPASEAATPDPEQVASAGPQGASWIDKAGKFMTKPLMFGDATSSLGKMAGAATTPLGLGVLAYAMRERPRGTVAQAQDYLNSRRAANDQSNAAYTAAMNAPPLQRTMNPAAFTNTRYGYGPGQRFFSNPLPPVDPNAQKPYDPLNPYPTPEFVPQYNGYAEGGPVFSGYTGQIPGAGGQDDVIPMQGPDPEGSALAPGEFVFDATTVADVGDGSNEEGARKLEALREYIKQRKGRRHGGSLPPRAGNVRSFLKSLELE